jgi:hypothetical protein
MWGKFKIDEDGKLDTNGTLGGATQCTYHGANSSQVTLVVSEGIDAWTNGSRTAEASSVAPVAGFPAISISNKRTPDTCRVAVDVTNGQYVLASVMDFSTQEVAPKCAMAHELAEVVMQSLLAQG